MLDSRTSKTEFTLNIKDYFFFMLKVGCVKSILETIYLLFTLFILGFFFLLGPVIAVPESGEGATFSNQVPMDPIEDVNIYRH